jgi:hypothetical protein
LAPVFESLLLEGVRALQGARHLEAVHEADWEPPSGQPMTRTSTATRPMWSLLAMRANGGCRWCVLKGWHLVACSVNARNVVRRRALGWPRQRMSSAAAKRGL